MESELLKAVLPILVIEYLAVFATIIHIVKNKQTRLFSWEIWIFVVLFFNIIGMVLYFTIGKEDDE